MVARFRPERAAGTWGESAQRSQLHIWLPGRDEAGQGRVRGGHATRGAVRAARRGEGEVREGGVDIGGRDGVDLETKDSDAQLIKQD